MEFFNLLKALRETYVKQLEVKNHELVEREEQIYQLSNQVKGLPEKVRNEQICHFPSG